ncbi:MAG TPA: hypothetical protein V6D00_08180 [Pantanalinema sp.]
MSLSAQTIETLLEALSEQLAAADACPVDLVVCGGTAMNFLGFAARPTKDVDVVALLNLPGKGEPEFLMAKPLPAYVLKASALVAKDFGISPDWLNDGPADLLRWGLPEGAESRLIERRFGACLTVHFLARPDLICLKLYAYADSQAPRHRQDLLALEPTHEELETAANWVRTHDDSDAFLIDIRGALATLGAPDVAARIG